MRDESESFWCFVALMERLGPNFNRDQNGMHSQLFALSKVGLCVCVLARSHHKTMPVHMFKPLYYFCFDCMFKAFLTNLMHQIP